MPFGCASRVRTMELCRALRSSRSNPNCCSARVSSRSEMLSPLTVGMVETRTSMLASWPRERLMRPSCGRRFSAMSMCAMTLSREMIADCSSRNCGGTATSCRMPSIR